jgi:AsmA protein
MKSFLKWGAIIAGCLVVVIIAALLLIPLFVDVQKYKPLLETKVAEATGRSFSVGDDLRLSLFPWAGLSFSNLRLGNPAGFAEKDFVAVQSFEVRVKLLPLLSRDIQIKRFVLNQPRIVLVKNKNGRGNWQQPEKATVKKSGKATTGSRGQFPISALTVGEFSIQNGSVLWIDHNSGQRKEITDISLALKDVSLERPVQLKFSAFMDDKPLTLEGTVGPVEKGLKNGRIPLDLSFTVLKQLAVQLKGRLENPAASPAVDLDVTVAEFSPRKLVQACGHPFPVQTTDPKALSRLSFQAHVKADADSAALSNGILHLDQSRLNFSATATQFSRPKIKFDLVLDQIDLDRYLPPQAESSGKSERQPGPAPSSGSAKTVKQKTDYTPLRRLMLDGRLKIGRLVVKKAKLQDILLQVKARNGIISLDPMKLNLYQGNAAGNASLNVSRDIPRTTLNLQAGKIQVGPLLRDVLGKDILEGQTHLQLQLAMAGDEPEQIKKTLNGKGQLHFEDGAIIGIDLAAMVRNVASAFGLAKSSQQRPKTDFAELTVPFTIKNGVVNTPQSVLRSPFVRVTATGSADLVKETLDFRVQPKAVASIKGQGDDQQRSGIMVPVLVSGTFSAPRFRPDLSAAAKQKIEKEIFESKEVKKIFKNKETQPLEKDAKNVLKGLLGQ